MAEERSAGQTIRIVVGVVGLVLLIVWCLIYFNDESSQETLWRVAPTEADPVSRGRSSLESTILHFGIPATVIGFEAAVLLFAGQFGKRRAKQADKVFAKMPVPSKSDPISSMPALLTSDIDACLTPPARRTVNLRATYRIRRYCDYVRDRHEYPPLILVSARSQEYTELMCQTLGLIDPFRDVACVLENGMALYLPHARVVEEPAYITSVMKSDISAAGHLLRQKLSNYEFEPKNHMITINVERQRALYGDNLVKRQGEVLALRERVNDEIKTNLASIASRLQITSTINAVDIVPQGVNKLEGLKAVLDHYNAKYQKTATLSDIASIGNSEADSVLLQSVGKAFCSLQDYQVITIKNIVELGNKEYALDEHNSEAVAKMIEIATGLKLP